MTKALVVFSGGLDSILAVKILQEQGVRVTALSFVSYFFNAKEAKKSAKQLGIELIIKDISNRQLDVIRKPQYGHGKGLNPCIDCHGLMFGVAGKLAGLLTDKQGFDLIATGEVLGQRPFSQNGSALKKVEKLAGIDILRPLSAKLLPKTSYEEKGLIDREKLLDISGRNRQRQLELTKKYKIKHFPSPAGGCRLTESEFGAKVKQLLENDGQKRKLNKTDFELLRIGRHYWIDGMEGMVGRSKFIKQGFPRESDNGKSHIILGKNYEENEQLKKIVNKNNDLLLELEDIMGPTALIIDGQSLKVDNKILDEAKKLVLGRTKKKNGSINEVKWKMIDFSRD